MATDTKQIMEKLDIIKSELDYIKKNMVSADAILTKEDKFAFWKIEQGNPLWIAYGNPFTIKVEATGKTPEEAVAKLWLALNKK